MEVAATILTIIAATILTIILLLLLIFLGLTLVWKPSPCLKTLGGKHVLITGGSSGIGLAIAKEALSQGAFLTLIARNSAKLEKAIDKLVDNKTISADRIFTKIADVGDYETLADAIEQSFQWRAIDVVVCNAGWARVGYIDEIPIKDLHATINTNLSGMVNTLHVALRLMKHRTKQGHARPPMSVVLVSSLAGLYAQYGGSVYTATKYGVKGLAEALRLELMPYKIGVSVAFPGWYRVSRRGIEDVEGVWPLHPQPSRNTRKSCEVYIGSSKEWNLSGYISNYWPHAINIISWIYTCRFSWKGFH